MTIATDKRKRHTGASTPKNPCKKNVILEEYSFPIYGCQHVDGKLKRVALVGTAFYINNGYFLTARHVVDHGGKYAELQIGYLNQLKSRRVETYSVDVLELYPDQDLALISANEMIGKGNDPKAFDWAGDKLKVFQEIRAMGFPLGFDPETSFTNGRGMTGTLMGNRHYKNDLVHADCYELSFQCPRGLSGSCLLDSCYNIHGMIFGNVASELEYFNETEKEVVGGMEKEVTLIKSQTTFIGMAVMANDIYAVPSDVLGMNYLQYFQSKKMISKFIAA